MRDYHVYKAQGSFGRLFDLALKNPLRLHRMVTEFPARCGPCTPDPGARSSHLVERSFPPARRGSNPSLLNLQYSSVADSSPSLSVPLFLHPIVDIPLSTVARVPLSRETRFRKVSSVFQFAGNLVGI